MVKREPYAKVIADSLSPKGQRLTTLEVRLHRLVLAELDADRVLSVSRASSRASVAVVSGTAWENFFAERCSARQQDLRQAAVLMRQVYEDSKPEQMADGQWHMPYVRDDDFGIHALTLEEWVRVSVARCARASCLAHDGERDPDADLALYERVVGAERSRWSPMEHVATPDAKNVQHGLYDFYTSRAQRVLKYSLDSLPRIGNLSGWRSLRVEVEAEREIAPFARTDS